jgi:hypothetical protein
MRALARRHGINPKTVAKWKKREFTADRRTGPTVPKSTVLSVEQEAILVAFRKHTLLSLDDCLYALQATIPQLTRSSLHRCLERHGISRLPEVEGDTPRRKKFDTYPIGFFHIDLAEVRTAEGKLYRRLLTAQLHGADSTRERLGRVERAPGRAVPEAARTAAARSHRDHRRALRARPCSDAATACGAL